MEALGDPAQDRHPTGDRIDSRSQHVQFFLVLQGAIFANRAEHDEAVNSGPQ